MSDCSTNTASCTTVEECCPVEKSLTECQCPVEGAVAMGQKAFFQAMKEVHVESLKERIRKQWGDKIDRKSDALVKAMGTQWESLLAQAKAHKTLHEEYQSIMFGQG